MAILLGVPVGLLLGAVLQRSDFCMHSALREVLARRAGPNVRTYLVALGLQLVAVNGLAALGVFTVSLPPLTPLAAAAGGVLFGVGMVTARG